MKLIKFPSPNLTNNSNKTDISLPYQEWEIEQIIENLSEDEQDRLIEKISTLAQEWELTLDAELELSLQTKYKQSKTSLGYTDWLYDLAQEEVYRAYAIEQLDKQKNKTSIAQKEVYQSLVSSNNSANDKPISSLAPDTQIVAATTATPTDVSANQTTNNNFLLSKEEQINQIIENLSEGEQDTLIEKIVLLFEEWILTTDTGLELALKREHQKSQPNITYQDFLYELAESQVYREYAIQQLELAKQSGARFIKPVKQIEKVYSDEPSNISVKVDNDNVDEPIFDSASQAVKEESSVYLLNANNHTINNDGLATSSNSDIFIREKLIFDDVSPSAKENVANKISLDCYQANVSSNQGHQNEINKPLIVSNSDYHITEALATGCNFSIKSISSQTRYLSSATYNRKNSLPLTKAKKTLLMHVHQGKGASIHRPPSMPP